MPYNPRHQIVEPQEPEVWHDHSRHRSKAEVRADAEREALTQEREARLTAEARIRELEEENRRLRGG